MSSRRGQSFLELGNLLGVRFCTCGSEISEVGVSLDGSLFGNVQRMAWAGFQTSHSHDLCAIITSWSHNLLSYPFKFEWTIVFALVRRRQPQIFFLIWAHWMLPESRLSDCAELCERQNRISKQNNPTFTQVWRPSWVSSRVHLTFWSNFLIMFFKSDWRHSRTTLSLSACVTLCTRF